VAVDIEALFELLADLEGAALGDGAFATGPAIWLGRREVAHLDRDGALDVRLTKPVIRRRRDELRANPRVTMRSSASDWIAFDLNADTSSDEAIALVRQAIDANLPAAPPGPPPEGADLERRRRFH
jgi:Family of unknown function (DUF5519)